MTTYLEFPRLHCLFTMQLLWGYDDDYGEFTDENFIQRHFFEDFLSESEPKIDGFGGLDRESCECQSSDSPRKSNYTETRHPLQKVRRYSQKCVLQSRARKAIKRKKEK